MRIALLPLLLQPLSASGIAAAAPQSPAQGLVLTEDCNGNGIPDPLDIRRGTSADCQGDGIPDECQTEIPFIYSYDDDEYDYQDVDEEGNPIPRLRRLNSREFHDLMDQNMLLPNG